MKTNLARLTAVNAKKQQKLMATMWRTNAGKLELPAGEVLPLWIKRNNA